MNFFINGTRKAVIIFKESMGAFWYDRYKAVAEALLNLGISILLVLKCGVFGVFAGTFCSTVMTSVWVEPYILFRYRFEKAPARFYLRYARNLLVMAGVWFVTDWCCQMFLGGPLKSFLVRLGICVVVPDLLLWLVYRRTEEWQKVVELMKRIVGKLWLTEKKN